MQAEHIQRLLEIVGPINDVYIDIDGLKDICLLIAKIVDTYSSFTASHSIMVGEIFVPSPSIYAICRRRCAAN